MSITIPYSARLTGSTGATSTVTIAAPTPGNTLLVDVWVPTANAPAVSFSDNLNGAWPAPDLTVTALYGSFTCHSYRCSNLPNAPTSLSVTGTTGSFAAIFEVIEVAGMDNTSPLVSTIAKTPLTGGNAQIAHVVSYTTTNPSDFVKLAPNSSNSRNLSSVTSIGMVVVADGAASQSHLAYLADAGAAGAKSSTLTFSGSTTATIFGAIYKAAKPAVTVTGSSATEGTALRFTLTMASDPGAITDYGYSWGGTAVNGTDYDDNLANATFSAGLSFTGGNIRFASGTTTGTIDVPAVDNALDQPDRTLILTVGGVASTGGLITDNDAPPVVTFSDGVESFGVVTCVATLGAVSGKDVSFQVDTTNGTKTAGTNYTAIVAQTVTIPAGSLTAAITANTL